jgi:fibronectin-binding autotransporter adhesin
MKNRPSVLARNISSLIAAGTALALSNVGRSADIYWDGITGGWDVVTNWSTASGATTPDPAAVPGASDTAIFNITTANGDETISLNAAQAALGLVFNNTGTTLLQGGGTNRVLTLGTGGIVVNAGAGAATIGSATAGQNVAITLGGAQTWSNNSTSLLTIANGVTNGANLLTVTGSGNSSVLGVIGAGAGGITKTGAGTLTLSGVNTYTGANTVSAGVLRATTSAQALGTGAATVVLAGGSLELANDAALNFARNTTVSANSTVSSDRLTAGAGVTHTLGTLSIGAQTLTVTKGANVNSGTAGVTFGATTLTGASTLAVDTGALLTLGAVANGANLLTVSGAGNTTITGVLGNGAGGVANTGAGLLTLSGANTFTGGTTISAGTVRGTVAGAFGANTTAAAIALSGGTLDLFNDTGTTFTNSNTTVTANSTVSPNRATSAGTATTHTLGTLSIGAQTLTVARGANITGTAVGGVTFGATTLTGNATFAPAASSTLTLGAVGGAFGLTQNGPGTTVLSAAGTYSGGTTISSGILQVNNATAAGAASSIELANGGSGRLRINGGVTIGYNINVGTGQAGATGEGLIQQVGTGQATVNGTITLSGLSAAGGVFVGGSAVGNELVINGAINGPNLGLTQRDGRVIYKGGGTASNNGTTSLFAVTGTALVGATNGIPTGLTPVLGGSGNATLDLNGFDQTSAALQLGNSGSANNNSGTVQLGSKTLTVNGDISSISTTGANVTHVINALAGGAINGGATNRSIVVPDTLAVDDLVINDTSLTGSGGFTKTGTGTLALNDVTVTGPLTLSAGTLGIGRFTEVGSLTAQSLIFGPGPSTLRMKVGTGGDLITAGTLVTSGTTMISFNQIGGILPNGIYPLIAYSVGPAGPPGFLMMPVGHSTSMLVNTGTAIALSVTGNDRVVWDGTTSTSWNNSLAQNWKLQTSSAATTYIESDDVIFRDNPASSTVDVAANVTPSNVSFTNTTATTYTVTGAAGIIGPTSLTKTGDGTVVLRNPNAYTGATNVNQGVLELDHDAAGNVVLSGTSAVNVATGATLRLTRDDGGFTFNRNIAGTGTVEINPHTAAASTTAQSVTLSGSNTGHTGTLRLVTPVSATYRILNPTPAQLGNGTIEVQSGAQIYTANGQTYNNALNIAGTGFADSGGNIGALRLETNSVWAGPIVVNGSARIGAHNTTGTVSGNISGGDLTVNATNFNNNYTVIFTGTNSYGQTIIGGQNTQTAGTPSMRLNIGSGGSSGTLGAGNVTINGDSANGVLGFDRADGYTLASGQTITGAGSQPTRVFIDFDSLGSGFSDNGSTITLGTATANGGNVRVAQGRANAIANFSGNLTTGTFRVGTGQAGGVVNFRAGASVAANTLFIGEVANAGGTVNQATGSTVNVTEQLRVGHFGTETSTYNMNGGTLTLTGASPTLTPSTSGAGAASATGDNNINALATPTIVGGGIYLGVDGTGIFNQSNGTVTTNWIVLDNRGDTGAGANMLSGIDQYNLSGGTLNIRSNWGVIGRNVSTEFNFTGGTVRVDNTGTGTGTGANINVPFDSLIKIAGTGTLDTNGAGNGFTLSRNILGTGTLALAGGGSVTFNPNAGGGGGAFQTINSALTGSNPIVKLGAGTTGLFGSGSAYTGAATISAGRLDLPSAFAASSVTVANAAAVGGEPTLAALTLGSTTGGGIFVDASTSGALKATNLILNGTTTVDFSAPAAAAGAATIKVLDYTNVTGALTFALANAASYRSPSFATGTAGTVNLNLTTKELTWTGTGGAAWDVNTTTNWNDTVPAAEKFFYGDRVTFGDGPTQVAVTVTSGVSPWKTTVNSNTNNYTFTSTTNGISGPGSLEKAGTSLLTLSGPNTYSGKTVVSGGTLAGATLATSLGNGAPTNTIELSGGGRLSDTGAVALDLGPTRSIAIGAGGGSISHNNATAATITLPGNLSGSGADNLSFHTNAAGGGTFVLSGDNSGYTGNLSVDALSTGVTTLRILTQSAAPAGGTITVNHPAAATAANQANTLELAGISLPATVGLRLTGFLTAGAISQRSQVASNGVASISGPIGISGNAGSTVQFSPPTGQLTINGNITETSPGAFGTSAAPGTVFFRNTGDTIINGTINLPTANVVRVDNTGITTLNSTGNNWLGTEVRSSSTLRIGANNALPTSTVLLIGQTSDAGNSFFDLNGFNQQIGGLNYLAGNGANTRGIINGSATPSTLTINVPAAGNFTFGNGGGTNPAGNISGNIAIVKDGPGTQALAGATNTYTGNVTVNGGLLIAGGNQNSTALGSPTTAGRTVTVNPGGGLSFTTNNVFGNGVSNANLPSVVLNNGTTLTSTRYNVLGPVTLNGATLTQSATDSGAYEGFQFKGTVTVGGTAASLISTGNGKANHLDANTTFNVADATGSSAVDLLVSAPLRNQSGDFGSAIGALAKSGLGTLELADVSTYTGVTTVNAGTLLVTGSIAGSTTTVNSGATLGGSGTVGPVSVVGGTLSPGTSPGTLTTGTLSLDSASVLKFELALAGTAGGGVNDLINVTGNLTLDGTVQVTGLGGFSNGTYRLINYSGTLTNNTLNLESGFLAAHPGSSVDTATAGQVNLAVIPEPGALMGLLGGLGMLVGLRRLRRTA